MKKISLIVAFLLVVTVLAALRWAWWSDGEALRELDGLAKRAQAEDKLCTSAVAALHNPDFEVGTGGDPIHVSRKGALAAIEVMEKMPSWLPANATAYDYYIDHSAEFGRNWHRIEARAIVAGFPGPCSILDSYRQLRALLNDIAAYHFAPADARRVRAVTRRYLVTEPRFRSLLEGLVKYSILISYLKAENSPLVARAEPELAAVARIYRSYYAILLDAGFLTKR